MENYIKKKECSLQNGKIVCNTPEERVYTRDDVVSAMRPISETNLKVIRGLGAYENTKKAVDSLGGMCKFVNKGDLVAVKANMTGGTPALPQTFTNKEVLSSVIDQIRECGGNPFVYDSSMIWTEMESIAEKSDFYKWGQEKNVPIVNLTRENQISFDYGEDTVLKVAEGSQLLKESDVIINVPVAKTHIMTGITSAIKNMYGSIPVRDKAKFHALGINETIGAVARAFRPNLTVVDMTLGCEGGGPLSCRAIDPHPDTVIASTDPVCADAITSQIMGYDDPKSIRHLEYAEEIGTGKVYCGHDIKSELIKTNPKDYNWDVVPDKGAIASIITDMIAKSMEQKSMIPFMDMAADFWLGKTAYWGKYGMSDIWDFVLYQADQMKRRIEIDQTP